LFFNERIYENKTMLSSKVERGIDGPD
jgi:hypothetical protein